MTSSSPLSLPKRRKMYVRLLGDIQHALNQALAEEHEKRGLTRAQIGKILGLHRSWVTKKLTGTSNMTLETLTDLAFAMDRQVKVSVIARKPRLDGNQPLPSPVVASASQGVTTVASSSTLTRTY